MTPDQKLVLLPWEIAGYAIFTAVVLASPVLWPLGALIAARQAEDALIDAVMKERSGLDTPRKSPFRPANTST